MAKEKCKYYQPAYSNWRSIFDKAIVISERCLSKK